MPLIAYLWIAFAINYTDRQMVYAMFPALQADLGFVPAQLGLIGAIFLWVYTLAMPLAGRAADLWRRDRLILSSLILWSIATLGCGISTSTTAFLAWRAVMGLTEALYYPAALALIAASYPDAARSRALGIHQSAQLIGVIAGGWYGGWAADHVGWRSAFWVAAAVGIAYSAILARSLNNQSTPQTSPNQPGNLSALLGSPVYLALCAAFAAFCAIQWIFFAWFPTFLQERFQLSMTDSGWNATVFVQGSTILGILLGGVLADRLRKTQPAARIYVTAAGAFIGSPFAYLTFSSGTLLEARCASAAFGLFAGFLATNVFSAAYDVVPVNQRGLAGGVLNMAGGLSSGVMIYMAGIWKQSIGFPAMVQAMMAVSLVFSAILFATAARPLPLSQKSVRDFQ